MAELVLGLDVGGTSTRALLADTGGRRLGTGRSGGGNPTSRGRAAAAGNVTDAVRQALGATPPQTVAAGVMGIAGALALPADTKETLFKPVWERIGLSCGVDLVGDSVVAFSAGSPEPDGTVLIAGTGAVAIEVADYAMAKRADGYGWLLGDRGSGVWLGREAVYAALQHASRVGPGGTLVDSVVAELAPSGPRDVDALIHLAMAAEPVSLSRLAPLVTAAAESGDPVALDIADRAAAELLRTAAAVQNSATAPIVLAGSLATGDNAVSRSLRRALVRRFPAAPVRSAYDGAAGAAWLAARRLIDDESRLRELHALLVPQGT